MNSSANRSHDSDDVALHNLILQFQVKIMSVVHAKNDYDFQCVAGVASSINKNSFIMNVFMNDEKMKLSRRVTKKINKILSAETKKYQLKLKYEVKEGKFNESPFASPFKNKHYSLFLIRLLNMLDMKYLDWIGLTKTMTDSEAMTLLRLCLDKALYPKELVDLIPNDMIKDDLGLSLVLKNILNQLLNEYQEITGKYIVFSENIYHRIRRLVNVDASDEYHYTVNLKDIYQYLDEASNPVETWSRASMLNVLAESSIRHFQKFSTRLAVMLEMLLLIEQSSINKDSIFKGIPQYDQIILTENSSLVISFPGVDMINEICKNVQLLAVMMLNALLSFQNMIQVFGPYLETIKDNVHDDKNERFFKKISAKKESKVKIEPELSSPLPHETPFSFFPQVQSESVTREIKINALQKIKEMERRADAHRNRSKSEPAPDMKLEMQTNDEYRVSLTSSTGNKELQIFALNDTKHLYICFDIDTISPDEKMQAYKSIVMQSRLLSQDSLGQNGIKLYCLDLLVVKCKTYNNERLLFTAHKIEGTDDYVFIADEVVSHKDYEALLNHPKSMQKRAQDRRDLVNVSPIGRIELTQEEVPIRNSFQK